MPLVFKCSKCGKVLFVEVYIPKKALGSKSSDADKAFFRVVRFADSKPKFYDTTQPPTPYEVASYFGFRCPYCGAKLGEKIKLKIFVNPKQRKIRGGSSG